MPQAIPKWDDIASSERFRALPSEQQESLRGAYFTDFVAPSLAPESVGKARQEWDALTSPKNQPGVWSDIKNTLSMGFQGLALDAREVARRTFGERFVGAVDSVDEWMHGQPSEELLKGKIAQAQQALTPQMQAALSKEWWNDETNSPGEAWSDPRAYLGGVMQSLPGTVITMAPALGIAKGMYAAEIARGATQAVAAARAATAAQIAGGLTEGLQQAGQTGREVREQILGLSEADLADSQALGTLMDGGLSFEDARAKLAEDASAKAMTLAGVATGIFGGTGDRVLAKAFTKGLSGNLAARIAKGAAAEGLLEELPQSGLSRMAANVGLREAQPDTPITKGALGEALGGAVMGGLMGGGMATVSRQAEPVERTVNKIVSAPDADTAIAAATSSLDQALQTADTVAQNILPPEGIIRRAMPPAPIPEGLPELPGSQEADLRGLAQAGRAARYDTAFNALEPAQDAAKQTELDALATESKVPAALYDAETADRVAAVAGQTEAQPTAMQLALQRAQERAQAKQATPVAAEAPQAPPAPASQASDDVIPLTKLFRREQLAEDETRRMIERGYAELRNDGTLKGTEAGFRMLNRLKRQPNKVQIKGTPVAEMDDAALAEAAQSHPMSAFRQAAQDEIDRRANDSPQNVPSGSQFPNGERSQNENVRPQIGNDQVTATEPPPRTDTPAVGAPASQAPAVGQESIPAPSKPAESTASVPAVDAIAPSGAISANRATNPAISAASETILGKPVTDLTAKQLRQYAQMKGPKAEAAQAELDRRDLERQAKQGDTPSAKLLRVIAGFGGINTQHALDISGEKNALKLGGLRGRIFRKDGLGIDDVATYLHERGWITDTEYADVDGGTQRARDLIRNAIDGRLEPILPADVEAEMRRGEAERALAAAEEEAAVEGLPASDAADIKDISEAFAVIPQSEWARLDELATTMSDAEWQAYVVKYAKELSNAGSQPENAQGDRSGEAAGAQAQAADAAPAEEIALVGETEEEIAAREAAEKQAADEASAAAKAADDKAKLAADRQAIKDRSAAAADTFQLGQSAEENLSGQRDLLAPANPLTAAAAALEQAAQAIRQSVESQQEPARKPVLSEPPRTTVASTKVVEEFGDVSLRHDTEKDTWGAIWSNPRDSTTGGQWFKTEAEARERYAQMVKSEREKRDYASRQRRDRTLDLSRQMTVAEFDDIVERMRDGDITADEVRAGFERTVSGKDAITAELNKFTKDRLLRMTSSFHARPSDKKDVLVRSVYSTMLSTFDITTTGISYNPMERDGYAKALRSKIEALTDDDVKAFAERVSARRAEREERTKVALGAIENPQTLEDFETFLRVKKFSDMTPEQLERYDELRAEKGRERRKQADAQRGRVEAASQAVGAQIIETKHTKKGHDLFVVQLAQRVEREDYNRLNVAAKRLGGYYSSFRGGGAVPGFQFTTRANAEAFQQLAAGDTKAATEVVQERRATNREAKKSAAAERLAAMADKMEEAADESLSQDRLANTARRARMASSAEAQARANQQMARTLRAISDAIEEGRATNLDGIRNRKQVEELERLLQRAKNEAIRKEDPSGRHFEEQRHRAPRASDVTHVQYPQYDGYRSTFAEVARQVIQVQGGKMIGERLLRQTDDTKDYAKAVSAELGLLNKVLLGKRAQGEEASSAALFNRKADAEVAVRRSGMHRSAMVVPLTGRIGKGMYAVVLSPAEAKGRGLWAPKDDPRVRVSPELMEDILSKIDAHNERTRSWDRIHLAYMFDSVRESRKRLAGMGIENSSELRAALREYLRLRAEDAKQDRVRELERALAGNANVGFDFFPTPAPLAERMAEALEVEDGMTVLEPSAGKGNLADAVRALEPGAQIDVVEQSGTLREILEAKGYSLVGQDFNDFAPEEQYDRIIMNPPFSNGIDADHVRRAYDLLKPGGRLVAITGEGIFSRSDKKAEAFREWFDSVGGTAEQMEDAFTDRREVRTTSVRSRLLIIDKPGDATQEDDTAFSREKRGPAVRGMSVAQLQAEGAEVISKFTVPVIISESPQAAGKKAGIDVYDDAIAFAHDGNIHAIASAIPNPMLFEAAMWHEGTHIGLHLRYGRMSQAYKAAIDRVVLANKGIREAAKAWRERYGADKAEAVKQANKRLTDNEIAEVVRYSSYEEALAEMSEKRKGQPLKFIEQLALAMQRLMRAMGLNRLADFIESKSDAEALALLQHALGAVTKPNAQLRESAAPAYMRSAQEQDRNGALRGDPPEDEAKFVQDAVEGKSATDVLKFIATSAPNADYRLIAYRVLQQMRRLESAGMKFTFNVAHAEQDAPADMAGTMRGMTWRAFGSDTTDVWVQGADVTGLVGTSYETVLHELIHAVTQTATYVAKLPEFDGTQLREDVAALYKVHDAIREHFNARLSEVNGDLSKLSWLERVVAGGHNALRDPDEVISWALTNRAVQDYLEAIPYEGGNLWTRFVSAIRKVLGLPAKSDTALSEVLRVTDRIMQAPTRQMMSIEMPLKVNQTRGLSTGSPVIAPIDDGASFSRSQTRGEALGGAGPVSARQTSVAKGRPNGDASDAKAITDLLKSEPFFLHGLGGIDIPSQRVVLDGVVALGDNREISDAVVELIPVDVMNILARKQLSPDVLFHDKAVLEDLLTADRKGSVSVARNVANALVRAIASVSAKYGLSSSGVSSGNREVGTASGAGVSDGFHAASMPQIKAVGNRGTFDPANPNIMFKRGASIVGGQDVLRSAHEFVSDTFRTSAKFNLYHRTFSTQQHKAEINEDFKQVYLEGQGLISDKSRYANEAADQAPDILPRPDSFKSFATAIKNALSQSDIKAVSDALMGGTLYGGGSPMEGRVWTDAQLKGEEVWVDNGTGGELVKVKMNLTDRQIKLYRQALAAVAHSLRDFSTSLLSRYARNLKVPFNREQSFDDAVASVQDAITEKIEAATERQNALKDLARDNGGYQDQIDAIGKQIQELEATRALVTDLEAKTNGLIEHGYFPASRFGQFTVYVTKGDEQIFFGRYDTEREANAAAREQKKLHPDAGVELGQINTERFKLFQGLSLDALETFANHMDVEDQPVVQEFLRVATAERSILRRQIHRKGTPGYSEDVPRVLAQFITSNAQATSANYHMAEMRRMANEIKDGDVAREATKLVDYLQNPVEEAAKFRSLLFLNFIGGSIAHGIVNLTQPIMQTAPVLSQHTSYANAAKQIMRAAKEYSKGAPLPKGLADAVKRAKDEGIVAPQEIHQLMAQSGPSLMGKSLKWRAAMHLWGSVYAITEQFNRGTTFIAAYRIAEADKKLGDPYEFAKGIVEQTQGVYNRGNRPNLGRSAVGATVLTFKQYSLAYMELMRRVYKNDKRAFAIMALTLIAAAGLEGLPFAEDAEDLIDTLGAWMGFATNSKKTLRRWAEGIVGKDWADFALHGVSAGLPVDVSQRLGFQNLIPGTGMLNPNQKNKAGDVVELLGPAGQFLPVDGTATGRMVERLSKGDLFGAGKAGAPVAIRNALAGAEMMQTGEARDTKGKKIIDVGAQDAAFKMIGLQPSKVASASRRMGEIMDDKAIRDAREARIAELWAQGVSERRPDLVAEAREELRQWNADNDPEYRIRISAQQIYSRVRAMKQTRDQRTVKSAPPEMRAYVRRELADR